MLDPEGEAVVDFSDDVVCGFVLEIAENWKPRAEVQHYSGLVLGIESDKITVALLELVEGAVFECIAESGFEGVDVIKQVGSIPFDVNIATLLDVAYDFGVAFLLATVRFLDVGVVSGVPRVYFHGIYYNIGSVVIYGIIVEIGTCYVG